MTSARARKVLGWTIALTILGSIAWLCWPRPGCGVPGFAPAGAPPDARSSSDLSSDGESRARAAAAESSESGAERAPRAADAQAILHGTVRDSRGQPISGAYVRAHVHDSEPAEPLQARTEQDGRWVIARVEPGTLLLEVEARAAGHRAARARPRSVIVAGENPAVDIALSEAPGFVGRVLDARTRMPIEGAAVGVVEQRAQWMNLGTHSDVDGRCQLLGGLETAADVIVERGGYLYDRSIWHASEQEHLVLLQPADAAVSGTLFEPDGSPAVDRTVYLSGAGGCFASLNTDEAGRFRFGPFASGAARVFAFALHEDGPPARCVSREVQLSPGENEIQLRLERPAEARISGRVLHEGIAAPRANILVRQWAPGLSQRTDLQGWTLSVGDDGRFELGGLFPATYTVMFQGLDGSAATPGQYEFELTSAETSRELEFRCVPGSFFLGSVVEPYPADSLTVELWEAGAIAPVQSVPVIGREQLFRLEPSPRARYRLRLLDRGEFVLEIEVGPGSERQLELRPSH